VRLEPLLPIHELPLAPDTSADGFLARAFYRLYMSSELEKRQWAMALDEAMCALLDSEVSRRLDTIKLARLEATPALAKAAFENPEKRGTLYKRGKNGEWKERLFVLQGPLLFYCKPSERHEAARAIDVRMSSVRLSPRDSVAARERSYSLAVQSPERLFEVAPADVAGAEIECVSVDFCAARRDDEARDSGARHARRVEQENEAPRRVGDAAAHRRPSARARRDSAPQVQCAVPRLQRRRDQLGVDDVGRGAVRRVRLGARAAAQGRVAAALDRHVQVGRRDGGAVPPGQSRCAQAAARRRGRRRERSPVGRRPTRRR
jgi:hypothetical protein